MCFDGESIIVSLDEADLAAGEVDVAALGDEGMLPPFTNGVGACADARYDEPTTPEYPGGCTPTEGAIRSRWAALTGDGARPLPPRRPDSDSPLLFSSRGWGPNNGGADLRFRGMPASSLFGGEELPPPAPELAVAAGAGGKGNAGKRPVDGGSGGLSDRLTISHRTRVGPRTIEWTDGALWVVDLPAGASTNEQAWWGRVGALFDALRNNASGWGGGGSDVTDGDVAATPPDSRSFSAAEGTPLGTHPRDGYIHWLKRWQIASALAIHMGSPTQSGASFRVNSQWPLPPMDTVLLAGRGGEEITSAAAGVGPWHAGTLGLAVQPDTRVVARGALGDAYSTSRLLCSRRGVVTGAKPKLLTGRADGWLLRQYAYMATGLAAEG